MFESNQTRTTETLECIKAECCLFLIRLDQFRFNTYHNTTTFKRYFTKMNLSWLTHRWSMVVLLVAMCCLFTLMASSDQGLKHPVCTNLIKNHPTENIRMISITKNLLAVLTFSDSLFIMNHDKIKKTHSQDIEQDIINHLVMDQTPLDVSSLSRGHLKKKNSLFQPNFKKSESVITFWKIQNTSYLMMLTTNKKVNHCINWWKLEGQEFTKLSKENCSDKAGAEIVHHWVVDYPSDDISTVFMWVNHTQQVCEVFKVKVIVNSDGELEFEFASIPSPFCYQIKPPPKNMFHMFHMSQHIYLLKSVKHLLVYKEKAEIQSAFISGNIIECEDRSYLPTDGDHNPNFFNRFSSFEIFLIVLAFAVVACAIYWYIARWWHQHKKGEKKGTETKSGKKKIKKASSGTSLGGSTSPLTSQQSTDVPTTISSTNIDPTRNTTTLGSNASKPSPSSSPTQKSNNKSFIQRMTNAFTLRKKDKKNKTKKDNKDSKAK